MLIFKKIIIYILFILVILTSFMSFKQQSVAVAKSDHTANLPQGLAPDPNPKMEGENKPPFETQGGVSCPGASNCPINSISSAEIDDNTNPRKTAAKKAQDVQ